MADTESNPFASLRRSLTPIYVMPLPELREWPGFALELVYDGPEGDMELRGERMIAAVASKQERAVLAGVEPADPTPEQMRALVSLEAEQFELDRRLYPGKIIRGWRNPPPGPDGQPLPFTVDYCRQFLDPANGITDTLFEKIRKAAKLRANFPDLVSPEAVEAASGNS